MERRTCRSHSAITAAYCTSIHTRWMAVSRGKREEGRGKREEGSGKRGVAIGVRSLFPSPASRFPFLSPRLDHNRARDSTRRHIAQYGLHARSIDPLSRLDPTGAYRLQRVQVFETLAVQIHENGLAPYYSAGDAARGLGTQPVGPQPADQLVGIARVR